MSDYFETVIIGAGQAGLATGYHLRQQNRSFVILEANERVGDNWRKRFDSLKLYSPARFDALPGWDMPVAAWTYPTKDQLADYFEAYAERFELPIITGVSVDSLRRESLPRCCLNFSASLAIDDFDHRLTRSGSSCPVLRRRE